MESSPLKLIECPRDAMQGIKEMIPTELKIEYINQLLKVGFDTLDFGSFVSPKAIPQMKDTYKVVDKLELDETKTKLLAIVANKRGAKDASQFEQIYYLGYPFSISETFQLRNTNSTIDESFQRIQDIIEIAESSNKEIVLYISMGFGNPYGDPWSFEFIQQWISKLIDAGISIFQLSDTIGVAKKESIEYIFSSLLPAYPDIEFGAHFHTTPNEWREKIESAYANGCRRFDSAIKGYGGCPMAKDELVGNMPTENLIYYLDDINVEIGIDRKEFNKAMHLSQSVFPL